MVSLLSRRKFVGLCIHGLSGWQDEVNSLVFHICYLFFFVLLCICVSFSVLHMIFFCIFLMLCVSYVLHYYSLYMFMLYIFVGQVEGMMEIQESTDVQ